MVAVLLFLSVLLAWAPVYSRATPLPCAAGSTVSVSTSLGSASGVADTNSVTRFAVRYATADRWQASTMATEWELPNNSSDPSSLPLACPQPSSAENSANTDEDCLSMMLYVPNSESNSNGSNMPAMMWIHGGSFIVGSATGPGLDGSTLAEATESIVAVVQYRLGAFGFLSPSGESNLAVRDMITALQFLQTVLPSFNGDASRLTIAGQSSGASMVRALLATPSASSLFARAILQSDPMDYGFLSTGTFNTLNNFLISQLSCDANASLQVFGAANTLDASAGAFEPMRPVKDGSLISTPLDATEAFPSQTKPVLVSNVQDEAGPAIYGLQYPTFVSESSLTGLVNATLGSARTAAVLNSSFYTVPAAFATNTSAFDARAQLERLGTDQIWRCPAWTFARSWAAAGGAAYVGVYVVGATYPDNAGVAFCAQGSAAGVVCHEDDIEIVFGTVPGTPSAAQASLVAQMQARYGAFLAGGDPNADGFASWAAVAGSSVNAIVLGGDGGAASVGACEPGFWGVAVPYDYQEFDD